MTSSHLRRVLRVAAISGLVLLAMSAEATQVRQLNIQEMTSRAARVFSGRCVAVHVERDAALGLDVTVAEFEVAHAAKGRVEPRAVVRMLGGGQGASIPGRTEFAPGEDVVLFLYGESRYGLTSPVGMGQGAFKVVTDKLGRKIALNEFDNGRLFDHLDPTAADRIKRHVPDPKLAKPVSPQALLDMAEALGR